MNQGARLITPTGKMIDLPPDVYRRIRQMLSARRRAAGGSPARRRLYLHPNRAFPMQQLDALIGVVSLGGDALADSEALYDES